MKIIIGTQVLENYGDTQNPYWKPKGGSVYVVRDLTPNACLAMTNLPQEVVDHIEVRNEGFEEYIRGWEFADDNEADGAEWENPIELRFVDGRWCAVEVVANTTFGYLRKEIASRTSTWVCGPAQKREEYKVSYRMVDGTVLEGEDALREYLAPVLEQERLERERYLAELEAAMEG